MLVADYERVSSCSIRLMGTLPSHLDKCKRSKPKQNISTCKRLPNKYSIFNIDNIPIGAVNIDSMWSSCINNFVVDRKKFPNMEQIVKDFHAQDIRVILVHSFLSSGLLLLLIKNVPNTKKGSRKNIFLTKGKTFNGGMERELLSIFSTLKLKNGSPISWIEY